MSRFGVGTRGTLCCGGVYTRGHVCSICATIMFYAHRLRLVYFFVAGVVLLRLISFFSYGISNHSRVLAALHDHGLLVM